MSAGPRAPAIFSIVAGLLVVLFLAQSFLASRVKSPVFDETIHIAAALSYVQTGTVRANLQHPPLLKDLSGLSMWLAGLRLPQIPQTDQMLSGHGGEIAVGRAILAENGPDRVLFWARLPLLVLSTGLAALLYLWGRELLGELAALAALFLCAFDPTILGHSFLLTMDDGLATFTVLFMFALWKYLQYPDVQRLVFCGLAMGTMLTTKFSAVFLLPVALLLLLCAVRWPLALSARVPETFLRLYGPRTSGRSGKNTIEGYPAAVCAFLAMCLIALVVIQLVYFSPGGLFLYITGLTRVNADHDPAYLVYLAGRLQHHFLSYFAVAWLLKEPIATILLVCIGSVLLLRSKNIRMQVKLFILIPPAVLFLAHTFLADDLGIRYIIPVLPFTYLAGGIGAAWLLKSSNRYGQVIAGLLGVWLVIAAAGIYPDDLSYFNEAACLPHSMTQIGFDGGTRCGPLWMDDSNVDWGQGLKQLKIWLARNAPSRNLRLAYFGTAMPETYGIISQQIGQEQLLKSPQPGLYAVSAHFVARVPALGAFRASGDGDWLRSTPPVAIVGHAFWIYDIKPQNTR